MASSELTTPADNNAVEVTPADLGVALERLRTESPLVQCITNIVVAQWTANVLLAAGAAPAMVDNPHEAGEFARITGGLLVNLGTPYDDTTEGMRAAVAGANEASRPWVLDPVAVGGLTWRTGMATELLKQQPAIVRGNASEILALTGGTGGKGVDAVDDPEAALDAARQLARDHGSAVAVSGEVDLITDGERVVRLANGHRWLTQVTGVGCALGALMAGFAAVVDDRLVAAAAATALLTVAADDAAAPSLGPGSFAVALLDQVALIQPDELAEQVNLR